MKSKGHIAVFIAAILFLSLGSCKKLIEIDPSTTLLLGSEAYKDSANVQGVLSGMYAKLSGTTPYRSTLSTLPGFSADELQYLGATYDAFINNALKSDDAFASDIWTNDYSIIYIANSIIEGVDKSTTLSESFRNQAKAEAVFVRSLCYFYLVNIYGDVPLVVSTDINSNGKTARTAVTQIYSQLTTDLLFAQTHLPATYSLTGNTRTRGTQWGATALLARIYLYQQNWAAAEAQASAVIANTTLFSLPADLTQVFTVNSKEAILQFYNDANGYTYYAAAVIPNAVSKVPSFYLTPSLVNAFEPNDARRTKWTADLVYNGTTYTYPYKYKSLATAANTEYYTVIRLAELYLIRAEARAQQENISGAQDDITAIRIRAGLSATTADTKDALLLAVEQERRIELNCEWGHRWFDLKRTNRVDDVIGALKPNTWKSTAVVYPIPIDQIRLNADLKQNTGY